MALSREALKAALLAAVETLPPHGQSYARRHRSDPARDAHIKQAWRAALANQCAKEGCTVCEGRLTNKKGVQMNKSTLDLHHACGYPLNERKYALGSLRVPWNLSRADAEAWVESLLTESDPSNTMLLCQRHHHAEEHSAYHHERARPLRSPRRGQRRRGQSSLSDSPSPSLSPSAGCARRPAFHPSRSCTSAMRSSSLRKANLPS